MSLSDRVRPNSEAAPWVVEEIKELEKAYYKQEEELDATMMAYYIVKNENKRLREALKQIADGDVAQSSVNGYLDEAYQMIARAALENE